MFDEFNKAHKLIDKIANPNENLGVLVKALKLDTRSTFFLDQLAELCPHLKHIKCRGYSGSLYGTLLELHRKSRLQNLKLIQEPREDDDIKDYVNCVFAFRETLTTVVICNKVLPDEKGIYHCRYYKRQYERLSNNLKGFPNLSNLEIRKYTYSGVETLDSVVENCPNLISLVYGIYQPYDNDFSVDHKEDWEDDYFFDENEEEDEEADRLRSIQHEEQRAKRLADPQLYQDHSSKESA